MNMRNLSAPLICLITVATQCNEPLKSAVIPFKTLVDEVQAIIPRDTRRSISENRTELEEFINNVTEETAYIFFNKASQADVLQALIEQKKAEIEHTIADFTHTTATSYATSLFDYIENQTIGYVALQRAFARHEYVILHFTAPWCPPCQFFEPVLERSAQEYAPHIRIIKVDITQHSIMGIKIESIPTFIFFNKGQEVYRQTGLDIEAIAKKYPDPSSSECKAEMLAFLEKEFRRNIKQYFQTHTPT